MMIAKETGLKAGDLTMTLGDTHLYSNHMQQVETLLKRKPREDVRPIVSLKGTSDIYNTTFDDIALTGYKHSGILSAPVAV
jgi:Thymidylate synthase